eukprot:CAMPEP_0185599804 /NCGR_PEP_ID=MMETSP0434-20130131/82955_1 /TAXON_ID=626734 ORGANISM="Favella taraikaensis, Strain Fe Narragansett Bay" /NCGR_SAMPLE_ID=MMETSP0434 /ASSEMBLY_ACC=CAM_ASM_000379 /LENGTH=48 /DNA_ID= /DNA_START= /DNA_END= /DNA_ORIENTATION=
MNLEEDDDYVTLKDLEGGSRSNSINSVGDISLQKGSVVHTLDQSMTQK